jgi:hypothetical protein
MDFIEANLSLILGPGIWETKAMPAPIAPRVMRALAIFAMMLIPIFESRIAR